MLYASKTVVEACRYMASNDFFEEANKHVFLSNFGGICRVELRQDEAAIGGFRDTAGCVRNNCYPQGITGRCGTKILLDTTF